MVLFHLEQRKVPGPKKRSVPQQAAKASASTPPETIRSKGGDIEGGERTNYASEQDLRHQRLVRANRQKSDKAKWSRQAIARNPDLHTGVLDPIMPDN